MGMTQSSHTPVAEVIASAPVVVFAASSSVWKSDSRRWRLTTVSPFQLCSGLARRSWCPFCKSAKDALKEAGIEFKDVEVTDAQKAELKALTGKTSVPQVFVKGQFIGGCNDGGLGGTVPLLKSGKLQEMLQ